MRAVAVIILIIFFAGCSDNNELPPGILEAKKMQVVLWDVFIAEGYTSEYIIKDSLKNAKIENAKLQQQIFATHQITKKEFYDSYNYYNSHADLMKNLLDSIIARGEKEKEKTLYSKPIVPAHRPFSLIPSPIPVYSKLEIIPMPIPTLMPDENSMPAQNINPGIHFNPTHIPTPQGLHNFKTKRNIDTLQK